MHDFVLRSRSAFGGYSRDFEVVTLSELADHALVSIATPLGGEEVLAAAVRKFYGVNLPVVGRSTASAIDESRFLGLQPGQSFLMFIYDGDRAVDIVSDNLGNAGYYTDQSDSWALLALKGERCHQSLERICPLDLHETVFPVGSVARTTMEHLGVIIFREDTNSYILMSPASSAQSFLEAVETSVLHVL